MPRLRDTRTGVVVDVDEATARDLGAAYEPADQPAPAKKPAVRRATASKSEQ